MSESPRPANAPMSRRNAVLMGLASIAAGLYPLAIGLGFASPQSGSVLAPLWVVAVAGACFVFIGTALAVPQDDVRLRGLLLGLMVTALAIVFDWVAFGPGERQFSGGIAFAGSSMHAPSSEMSGRVAFGIAAVLLDAFAVFGWYRWLRDLAARGREGPQSGIE